MFPTIFTDEISIGDCGMGGKYLELPFKYRRNISIGNSNGNYRCNIFVGDCGIGNNFFPTLGKIPTACFHLEIRRYVFKIQKKNIY